MRQARVLILVVMEEGLRQFRSELRQERLWRVLILVVMEEGLRLYNSSAMCLE